MTDSVNPRFRNPAVDDAAWLVGTWRVVLTDAEFLEEGDQLVGTMTGTWLAGHAFVVLRTVFESGPPDSVQVIGRDEETAAYETVYADSRGVSRIYSTTLAPTIWRLEREASFSQCFEATVDGDRIRGHWWKSADWGRNWQHDFELLYTRA